MTTTEIQKNNVNVDCTDRSLRALQQSALSILQGLWPDVAPVTAAHMLKLFKLGAFNSNHFFRVDKGFVAQVRPAHFFMIAPLLSDSRR